MSATWYWKTCMKNYLLKFTLYDSAPQVRGNCACSTDLQGRLIESANVDITHSLSL